MDERLMLGKNNWPDRAKIERSFIDTGFIDLLPLALEMAGNLGYDQTEVIEAIGKVNDKFDRYPPSKNRLAWFKKVFEEKLSESRADILAHYAKKKYYSR